MPRLYSDLVDGSGRRYYYGLTTAPGAISPAPALLTLGANAPTILITSQVFRTPATANLTINGLSVSSQTLITPNLSALSISGLVATEFKIRIITPALPTPDYTTDAGLAPTIVYIQTITPTPAQLSLQTLTINVTQGGNIGFISPQLGLVRIAGGVPNFVFYPIVNGVLTIQGLAPQLIKTLTLLPEVGSLTTPGRIPLVEKAFIWIDVDPPPPLTWTRVA